MNSPYFAVMELLRPVPADADGKPIFPTLAAVEAVRRELEERCNPFRLHEGDDGGPTDPLYDTEDAAVRAQVDAIFAAVAPGADVDAPDFPATPEGRALNRACGEVRMALINLVESMGTTESAPGQPPFAPRSKL